MAEEKPQPAAAPPKKPNIIKRLWTKLGITPFFILLAFKGALPPTIALAAYEAPAWAGIYTTLGYLVAIMAHLSVCIQPRGKFIQSMMVSVFAICFAAACALLEIRCTVSAKSTTGPTQTGSSGSAETITYDPSASTTAAAFLFLWVFLANTVKAARPQLMIPTIQFSIFTIVTSVYCPTFPDMAQGEAFVRRLLITFLTGFALATGVSLFVLPVTSRATAEKQMGGMLKLLKGILATHAAFMASIEVTPDNTGTEKERANAQKLRGLVVASGELFGKIKLELGFARKEIAFGKLRGDQYSEIFHMIRNIFQPTMGLSTFLQILRTSRERRQEFENLPDAADAMEAMKKLESEEWHEVMSLSHDAFKAFQTALFKALDHIAIQLEFEKRPKPPKNKSDVEETAERLPAPGEAGFTDYLAAQLHRYLKERHEVIQDWADHRDLVLPRRYVSHGIEKPTLDRQKTAVRRQKLNQNQLYLVLYIYYLNNSVGQAVLKMARWVDARQVDGTMKRRRLINPGMRRIRKLFQEAFQKGNTDETMAPEVNGGTNIYLGDALKRKKDPEHLAPRNWYEKASGYLRIVPKFFASDAASFGFRCAVAVISIGILAYLRQTWAWFLRMRGLWALIMTGISLDPHAGKGVFGFVCRTLGTVFAMVASIVIWYMCDHNHAGILVVFWVYMSGWVLFMIRKPQYAMVAMISAVTVVLIIGYELQVDVIGVELAESNGQPVYPVAILASHRLATVVAGLGVAFIWTYLPYPTTTHGALRQDLGSSLYILANYYSCVHTTLDARLHLGPAIYDLPENSPVRKLDQARQKVFGRVLLMLTRLEGHYRFSKFELPLGGRFPRETYREMIDSVRNIFTYLGLISYSSLTFVSLPDDDDHEAVAEEKQWLDDFRQFAAETNVTSHQLTTNLCLLSSSIRSGQPLPPYLHAPRPFAVGDKMQDIDPALLGVHHFAHPCYAAFAVGEVASTFIAAEMAKLTKLTKELIGEVDFSFHVISTLDDGSSTTSTLWENGAANGLPKKKGD